MKKTKFEVGETFQFGLKKLRVELDKGDCKSENGSCVFCYYTCHEINSFIGCCAGSQRTDGKDVVFVEVEEDQCEK